MLILLLVLASIAVVAAVIARLLVLNGRLLRHRRLLEEQAQLLDLASDAILVWDLTSGAIRFWNRGAEALYGWSKAEVLGKTPQAVLRTSFPLALSDINALLVHERRWEGELEHTCRGGRIVTVASRWALQPAAFGKPASVMGINTDITVRKEFEAKLRHQALHDPLTGLPNRTLFNDRLESALVRAGRHQTQLAVLFLDLDKFKDINDSLGHAAGDTLLKEVAGRLRTCLRAADTVARLGGDEFSCLLEDIADPSEVLGVIQRIQGALRRPIRVENRGLVVDASIGLALSSGAGTPETLLRQADRAMYQAKLAGRSRLRGLPAQQEPGGGQAA